MSYPIPDQRLPADAPVAQLFRAHGVSTLHQALAYVRDLPYARPSNPDQLALVLTERRGTCSSKHRLLAVLTHELGITDLTLTEGLIRFEAGQNAHLAQLLAAHDLTYLPEAHLYFRCAEHRLDLTSNRLHLDFERVLLTERPVDPARSAAEKVRDHQQALRQWLATSAEAPPNLTLAELWHIRERCIAALTTDL